MTAYTTLHPRIIPFVGYAPLIIVERALQDAVIEFYHYTYAWRHFPTPINMVTGTDVYTFDVPTGTRATKIMVAKLDDRELEPTSGLQRRVMSESDPVFAYELRGADSILLQGKPRSTDTSLVLEVAVQPLFESTSVIDDQFEQHYDAFTSGAIARVLTMPGQAWTNLEAAVVYQQTFANKVAEAKSRANNDNTAKVRVTEYGGM